MLAAVLKIFENSANNNFLSAGPQQRRSAAGLFTRKISKWDLGKSKE